jgi:hypothetical protein
VFETSKAEAALGFESTVPLRTGLERTVEWLDDRGRIDGGADSLDDRIVEAWRAGADEFRSAYSRRST